MSRQYWLHASSQGQLSETWSCADLIKAYSLLEVTCFYTWSFPEQPCKQGINMHFPNRKEGSGGEGEPSLNNCEQIYLFYKASWVIEIMLYSSTQSIIFFPWKCLVYWFIILIPKHQQQPLRHVCISTFYFHLTDQVCTIQTEIFNSTALFFLLIWCFTTNHTSINGPAKHH